MDIGRVDQKDVKTIGRYMTDSKLIDNIVSELTGTDDMLMGDDRRAETHDGSNDPGFINFTNGFAKIDNYTTLEYLSGSGYSTGSEKADEKVSSFDDYSHKLAVEEFTEKHPEVVDELKGKGLDIDYHDLNEAGYDKLAEELDENYRENMGGDTIMFFFNVLFYDGDNSYGMETGKTSCIVQFVINWETPYHRRGASNEVFVEDSFEYGSAQDIIDYLESDVFKKIVKNID